MFSVNTNNSALSALESLRMTNAQLTATQNAISSGKKVDTASDSPAVYSISQTMQGQIAGLSAVSDSLNFGQAAVGTALSATAGISASLISLRQVVTDGQQTGIDPTTINNQITQVLSLITAYANAASFNGVNLLATTTTSGVTYQNLNVVQGVDGSGLYISNALSATSSGNSAALGTNILDTLGITGLTSTAGGTDFSFSSDAAVATGNTFVIQGINVNSAGTATAHTWTFEFNDGTAALSTTPTTLNTVAAVQFTTGSNLTTALAQLVSTMNTYGFAASVNSGGDLVYTGNGSLGNAGTSDGVTLTAPTATLQTGSATASATATTANAVSVVASAITYMNTISAYLGSKSQQITGMQSFTSDLSDSLTSGVGALVDADMAAESAQLTSLQTKQSLAIQALSIANQQPQSLLTLFR